MFPPPKPRCVTGLDLGQGRDCTAIAILERSQRTPSGNTRGPWFVHYDLRFLERIPAGTPYAAIRDQLSERFGKTPLAGTYLAIDHTGVGKAILELFRDDEVDAKVVPITVTAGASAVYGEGTWLVPKKDLVGELQVLLQGRRFHFPPTMPFADMLMKELLNFQVKLTPTANDAITLWREGRDDDLVLATAIAVWAGEKFLKHSGDRGPYVLETRPSFSNWRGGLW
jgi:hypothetical protein